MNAREILEQAVREDVSDIFIVAGLPVSCRKNGNIIQTQEEKLFPKETEALLNEIYGMAGDRDMMNLLVHGDDDFSFAIPGVSRFRVSAYKQRGALSAVIRVITFQLPNPQELGIPEAVMQFADHTKGMILVTGSAGSGKSTTLACLIDRINNTRNTHIITLEDPLEYLHRHNKSIVSQREIKIDTDNYVTALKASLRQSPNIILLGEMRDYETISVAMTAAETGHLLFSTLHIHRSSQYHRPDHRCLSAKPAASDRRSAVHGLKCRHLTALVPTGRRTNGTCLRNYERHTGHPQYDPRQQSPPDRRSHRHIGQR